MKQESKGGVKQFTKSRFFKWLVVLATVLGILAAVYSYMQKPANGIVNNDVSVGQTKGETTAQNGHYTGSTVSFEYPGAFSSIQNNAPNGLVVEQLSMTAHSGSQDSRRISVTVKQLGSGVNMNEDAAYKLRTQDPLTYIHETVALGNQEVEKFSKQNGSEITYFIPGPHYYATISGTSSTGKKQLSDDMNTVFDSFEWLK